jgi:hypothetical protein
MSLGVDAGAMADMMKDGEEVWARKRRMREVVDSSTFRLQGTPSYMTDSVWL